jgi:hypothetical protein
LTATSSPRIGMAFPDAARSRVLRKPRVRSEWTTLKVATIKECVVSAPDNRESNPLVPPFASTVIEIRVTPVPRASRNTP